VIVVGAVRWLPIESLNGVPVLHQAKQVINSLDLLYWGMSIKFKWLAPIINSRSYNLQGNT